ncbi:unnamed protein product [Xylocopa violacea]|uniref:Odorant receptor n=1 Tax=Xylocopa violacea TaxID=135666 RepID=A0ABP1PE81_XYLVO
MHLLRTTHNLLTSCGCWQPRSSSLLKQYAYNVYCYYVLLLLYACTFCQFMDLLLNVETEDEFCDNIYLTLAMIVACQKIYSVLNGYKNIVVMTNMLENEPFQPETEEEAQIRNKCDKQARSNAILYAVLIESTVTTVAIGGALKAGRNTLPYRVWLPYSYTSLTVHIFIYVQQVISMVIAGMVNVSVDSLIWGLLMYVYSQIEIFECRLKKIKRNEENVAKQCIRYHNLIYQFAAMLNEEFKTVILVQFAQSILTICIRFYVLTLREITPVLAFEALCYSSTLLTQIYVFCWYGNEIKLKSLDISNMIFQLNWTPLDAPIKRDLLLIMTRAMSPIEITSAYLVTMNLESFRVVSKKQYISLVCYV